MLFRSWRKYEIDSTVCKGNIHVHYVVTFWTNYPTYKDCYVGSDSPHPRKYLLSGTTVPNHIQVVRLYSTLYRTSTLHPSSLPINTLQNHTTYRGPWQEGFHHVMTHQENHKALAGRECVVECGRSDGSGTTPP